MNRDRDPLDRLRRANPVPDEQAPTPDSPLARAAFQRIVATTPQPTTRRRRNWRRRTWFIVPAVLLLVATGFGLFRQISQPLMIACYAQANLGADRAEIQPSGKDPADACRPLWQPGGELNKTGRLPVPPLDACVLASGAVGVFPQPPGHDVCADLGLARPSNNPAHQIEADELAKVQETLSNAFLGTCFGQDDAVALARQTLAENHLNTWTVSTPTPFSQADPCASVAFDLAHRTLRLIPVSNPP
jgi:hypothetical protein